MITDKYNFERLAKIIGEIAEIDFNFRRGKISETEAWKQTQRALLK